MGVVSNMDINKEVDKLAAKYKRIGIQRIARAELDPIGFLTRTLYKMSVIVVEQQKRDKMKQHRLQAVYRLPILAAMFKLYGVNQSCEHIDTTCKAVVDFKIRRRLTAAGLAVLEKLVAEGGITAAKLYTVMKPLMGETVPEDLVKLVEKKAMNLQMELKVAEPLIVVERDEQPSLKIYNKKRFIKQRPTKKAW